MARALFICLLAYTVLQRLSELRIARRNTKELLRLGGVEFGAGHYWMFIALHTAFFLSMIVEFVVRGEPLFEYWPYFAVAFVICQIGRVWVIRTLGMRWTTRVVVLPGNPLVASGPFKIFSHPNYFIVGVELLVLPITFGLVWTALVFTILNAVVLLLVRIPVEESALAWSQEQAAVSQ